MTKDEALNQAIDTLDELTDKINDLFERFLQNKLDDDGFTAALNNLCTPTRPWIGLTAKEKHEFRYSHMTTADFIEAIEAKLKEKNT